MKVQAESFHLNGHIIGFGPQTQKLESPYKTPSSTLAVKGLIQHVSTSYPGFSPTRPYGARENLVTRLYMHMAESATGQGEANPVFWLAIGAGKIGPSCRSILRWSCEKNFFFWLFRKSIIDQVCFIKMAECWRVLFFLRLLLSDFTGKILVFWIGGRSWRLIRPYLMLFGVLISYVQTTVSYGTVYSPHPLPSGAARLPWNLSLWFNCFTLI